ncbi:MAG: glycoside hydrolase family 38 N-terminal domain-containing protein [Armatimonadota bacterium]
MLFFRILLSAAIITLVGNTASAENHKLWEIGKSDNNYNDLAISQNHNAYTKSFPNDVTFRIGKDEPAKSWPYIQPGPIDGWAGGRIHPFNILFDLPENPKGMFKLSINFIGAHYTSPPVLEIDINGKSGEFALPVGSKDDAVLNDPSKGIPYEINLNLSADCFKKGQNKIVLRSIIGSWLVYDAVNLSNKPDANMTDLVINKIDVTPTVRFVRRNGRLKQLVQIEASLSFPRTDIVAVANINGKTQSIVLNTDIRGNASAEIEIDEVSKPAPMTVEITSGGKTKSATVEVRPERHWTLYLQPSAHVDIGYTDIQENVAKLHNDNMTVALDLCDKYSDFAWNTETSWVESNYLTMMPEDKKEKFIEYARDGRIGCQANFGNMLTGICSHEGLIRNFYYAKKMSRKYGIPFDIASSSDVPTHVWTMPTVLAGSGIKYFNAGLNLVRAESFYGIFPKSPFYWVGPDGSKVLTCISPGYGTASAIALDTNVSYAKKKVDDMLRSFDRKDYPYDAAFGHGAFADNTPLNPELAKVVNEWNKTYAYPKIVPCRGTEFFQHLESKYEKQIPVMSGNGGVYWEDGAGSSAYETAITRCAKEELVNAEKLYSIYSVVAGTPYPDSYIDVVWTDALLYDEHTWGAGGSMTDPESYQTVEQWKRKSKFAQRSAIGASSVLKRGLDILPSMVDTDSPSVLVFNSHSWPVSGLVSASTPEGKSVEFWADDVPSMGVKAFPLSTIKSTASVAADGNVLENDYYRVEFDSDTGAVKSLFDKELNLELVESSSPHKLNEYIYYSGQGANFKDATREGVVAKTSLTKEIRPYGSVMQVKGSAYNTPVCATEVILYNDIKRIDFQNTLEKTSTLEKEAGYFAFPFNLDKPDFRIELPNGVFDPKKNMLEGGCTAWHSMQDFTAAFDSKAAVVWTAIDSPLITLCDINEEMDNGTIGPYRFFSAGTKKPVPIDNGRLYAYAFNNYWFTNYKASQGGTLKFRFSLTSMKSYDPVAASRFGQSVRNPLLARVDNTSDKAVQKTVSLPYSFCTVSEPNVYIQAIKKSELGEGTVIRLREVGGKSTETTVSFAPGNFSEAWLCNLMEDPQKKVRISNGKVKITVPANGLVTLQVK